MPGVSLTRVLAIKIIFLQALLRKACQQKIGFGLAFAYLENASKMHTVWPSKSNLGWLLLRKCASYLGKHAPQQFRWHAFWPSKSDLGWLLLRNNSLMRVSGPKFRKTWFWLPFRIVIPMRAGGTFSELKKRWFLDVFLKGQGGGGGPKTAFAWVSLAGFGPVRGPKH